MKRNVIILILCLIIGCILIYKLSNKFVYVNNTKLNICQKCVVIKGNHYCETYGVKESDK